MVTRNAPYLRWDDRRRIKVMQEEARKAAAVIRGNYYKWTPERCAMLALMVDKGYTLPYISQVLGCRKEAVRRKSYQDGIPIRVDKPRPRRAKKDRITPPAPVVRKVLVMDGPERIERMMALTAKIRRFA